MDKLAAVLRQSFVWYSQPLEAELARTVEGWRAVGEGGTGRYTGTRSGFPPGRASLSMDCIGGHLRDKVAREPAAP